MTPSGLCAKPNSNNLSIRFGSVNATFSAPAHIGPLLGNGDGTFQPGGDFNGRESPRDLAVAGVNHDGRPDIVVANGDVGNPTSAKNYVSVILNDCVGPPRHRAVKH